MNGRRAVLHDGVISGSLASVASALALLGLGWLENGRAAGPINAISHWLWKGEAYRHDAPRLRYTLPGYVIHHAMSIFWALVHRRFTRPTTPARTLRSAAIVSAAACVVDYTLTPRRLRPGFEKKLTRPSLALVYAAFAAGLAAGAWAARK
jgi:hypothetical protein